MKHPSLNAKKGSTLSASLFHQLNAYALAASTAGVGVLTLTQSSQAEIVYSPSQIEIKVDGGIVYLDLNHDGINDFQFDDIFSVQRRRPNPQSDAYSFGYMDIRPINSLNRVRMIESNHRSCAAALPRNKGIGPHNEFQPGASTLLMAATSNGGAASCPWRPVRESFLGLKFVIEGQIHYGWVRIKRLAPQYGAGFPAVIEGYAYESTPNKPIITGATKGPEESVQESRSLGALALGKK